MKADKEQDDIVSSNTDPPSFSELAPTISSVTSSGVDDVTRKPSFRACLIRRFSQNFINLRRKANKEKGVISVDRFHARYRLLSCIREGIRNVVMVSKDRTVKRILTSEDFGDIIKAEMNYNGQKFEFESFASSVFATIRSSLGIDERHYFNMVASKSHPYLEFISNSKSGQDFFLSHNLQFMFKSNKKKDVIFFLSILSDYIQHFVSYPHSLLVKFVGCYAIKLKGRPKKYFMVMYSIFFPARGIQDRFDIKGCTIGRYEKPKEPGSYIITVLKDKNFVNEELDFGDQGKWFLEQVGIDTKFMCDRNIMDYSLLIGRQRITPTASEIATMSAVMNMLKKITSPCKRKSRLMSNTKEYTVPVASDLNAVANREESSATANKEASSAAFKKKISAALKKKISAPANKERSDTSLSKDSSSNDVNFNKNQTKQGRESMSAASIRHVPSKSRKKSSVTVKRMSMSTVTLCRVQSEIVFPQNLASSEDKFLVESRKFVSPSPNRLHIIDGKEYRYFLGIVDFLSQYDWYQKLTACWKTVYYQCGDHSTKEPILYQHRFMSFLENQVR